MLYKKTIKESIKTLLSDRYPLRIYMDIIELIKIGQ